jgi:MoaA/NifB/PqqE/SkfB family radical SAM enzyme
LIHRVLREAQEMGVYFVTVSGGEPFIRPDLLDIFAAHGDQYFQVYTNGTLIDRKMAQTLSRLGNVLPAISVEGWEKETDARRGPGAFRKILKPCQPAPEGVSGFRPRHPAEQRGDHQR